MGGSSPPVKAMFTLKPTPASLPTCNTRNMGTQVTLCFVETGSQRDGLGVLSHLVRCSTAREEVPIIKAMQRQVENTGVCVEGLLGTVTMVDVLETLKRDGLG